MERADFTETQEWLDFQKWKEHRSQAQLAATSAETPPPREGTSNGPGSQGSTSFSQLSINDLLLTPGRDKMTELNPNRTGRSTWFSYDTQITKSVLLMMKSDLSIFCPKYRSLPEDIKMRWFKSFAQEFNWNPTYTMTVKKQYDAVAQSVFKNQMYIWKKNWKAGNVQPVWMTSREVWNEYIQYWMNPKTQKKSTTNQANRKSDRGGDGEAAHTTGSKSYARRFDEMAIEAGQPPNMVDFMIDTHKSKKTKSFVDKRAERIVNTLLEQEQNILSQETQDGSVQSNSLSQTEMNSLFLKEVECVKGRRFGFGSLQVFGDSSSSHTSTTELNEELRTANMKIAEMEKMQAEQAKSQAKQAKKLEHLESLLLKQFPGLVTEPDDDDDEE